MKELIALGAVITWAFLLGVTSLLHRPEQLYSSDYLFGDQGVNLLVADTITSGGLPYRDVAYPYGPLPIYIYAGLTELCGNRIPTYYCYMLVWSLLHLALLYLAVRRFCSRLVTSIVGVLAFVPTMLIPGAMVGGYANAAYIPVERCLLTALVLVYVAPSRRSYGRATLIGLFLGALQFTKFGGCFFVGGAIVILDLLLLRAEKEGSRNHTRWIKISLTTLAAFVAVEFVRAGLAFSFLNSEIAWDVVWPTFAARAYTTLSPDTRRPGWVNLSYFLGQQLTAFVGLIFSVIGLAHLALLTRSSSFSDPSPRGDEAALLLLPLFYCISAAAYFGHVHTYIQYAWCLMLAIPYALPRLGIAAKAITTVVALPCALLMLKSVLFSPLPPDVAPVRLPNGDTVFTDPPTSMAIEGIERECERLRLQDVSGQRNKVLILPQGAGYHYYFHYPRISRNVWYINYYFRPYDGPAFLAALDTTLAIVFVGTDDKYIDNPLVFPPDIAQAIRSRLGPPVAVTPHCSVFPVR